MAKIFLVTSGAYSDYGIVAAFSTHEKAASWISESGYCHVEEYEIDERAGHIKRIRYEATIDLEDGKILETENYQCTESPERRAGEPEFLDFRRMGIRTNGPASFGHITAQATSFVSADHALKLAAELRQQYLRDPASCSFKS